MEIIEKEIVRRHLRVRNDADDALIQFYVSAAVRRAVQYLQREIYESVEAMEAAIAANPALQDPMVASDDIRVALLLIVGQLYENREDVVIDATVAELPNGSKSFLDPYRINMGV